MKKALCLAIIIWANFACQPCRTTVSNAGPDQLNCSGTTAVLNASIPQADEVGTWSIVKGTGGVISSPNSPSTIFTKGSDSSYSAIWAIFGPCGASLDTVHLNFQSLVMNIPCPGISSVTYAGESYPTVQIGTQCWLAKNLNVGSMINSAGDQTNNSTIEKYCYNNDPANCTTYGGLYQWAEAVQYQNGASNTASLPTPFAGNVRGICPTGWHLPSDGEWSLLESTLGGSSVAGGALKSTSGLWWSPNTGATNSSGFSALPGGFRGFDGAYNGIGEGTGFWSSSESSATMAFHRSLGYPNVGIYLSANGKIRGWTARCTKD
jgi:uncharacterized protein (TIGR02145 family)